MASKTERFIVFYNGGDRPYIHPDHPVTRSEAVNIVAGSPESFQSVVSFEVGESSRDVSSEIVAEVVNRWADRGEPLTYRQYEFVELHAGMQKARHFQMEDA